MTILYSHIVWQVPWQARRNQGDFLSEKFLRRPGTEPVIREVITLAINAVNCMAINGQAHAHRVFHGAFP